MFSRSIFVCLFLTFIHSSLALGDNQNATDADQRGMKALSVFNVVTFPNSGCSATNGYNGTCYTASECTSKGGTASGTCASSFGVCCVFSLACGATSQENNTYAIISSYSTSSDADPCQYTFCRLNSDICKLRIDFDTMVLAGPYATTSAAADGPRVGDCIYDTLTVTAPGFQTPPVICGYNTGQHMYVPASAQCNTINIDIDTGTTSTTRKWQIKVTQYECGNQMAPEQDCLQYLTAQTGSFASFNWDISASTVASTQLHLSSQYYNICWRRQRSYCSICFSPSISTTTASSASSYGIGGSSDGAAIKSAIDGTCTGKTTQPATLAYGDYLEFNSLQATIGTTATIGITRVCGSVFTGSPTATKTQATACSWATPFKVGVHLDEGESILASYAGPNMNKAENGDAADLDGGQGYGYSGFYMDYWMNSC